MALIKCKECGTEFSNLASACPKCACPTSVMEETSIKKCSECGNVLNENDNVCNKCGCPINLMNNNTNIKDNNNNNKRKYNKVILISIPLMILTIIIVIICLISNRQFNQEKYDKIELDENNIKDYIKIKRTSEKNDGLFIYLTYKLSSRFSNYNYENVSFDISIVDCYTKKIFLSNGIENVYISKKSISLDKYGNSDIINETQKINNSVVDYCSDETLVTTFKNVNGYIYKPINE